MTFMGYAAMTSVTLAVSLMLTGTAVGECTVMVLVGLVFALLELAHHVRLILTFTVMQGVKR